MIVGQQNIFDRLVRDLRDASNDVVSHRWSRLCIDDHHRVVADDYARVWISSRRVRVESQSDLIERNLLFAEILCRAELRHHQKTFQRSNIRPFALRAANRSDHPAGPRPFGCDATMLSVRGKHCNIGPPHGKSRPFSSLESLQAVSVSAKVFGARVNDERHASLQQHAMTQEMAQRVPDAAERAALKLEEFLPYRLNVCSSLVSHALSRIYADRYKIGVPEWTVLVRLGQFESMTRKASGDRSPV